MEQEIWKNVIGYEGRYQVSNLGRVKSLLGRTRDRILKVAYNKRGYVKVWLFQQKAKAFSVHRLVCVAFHPNPYNKREVNHKNGIKNDNKADNLEWATPSENQSHAFKTGLSAFHKTKLLGNAQSVRVRIVRIEQFDLQGNFIAAYASIKEAAKSIGMSEMYISSVSRNKYKSPHFKLTRK